MTEQKKPFQPRNRRFSGKGRDRGGKKGFFGFGRKKPVMTEEEKNADSLDRQQSSENAKKIIESFEEDTKSYKHGGHPDGKPAQSLSFYIILGIAVAAVIVTIVLLFLRKGT